MKYLLGALIFLWLAPTQAGQTVYKAIGPDGKIVYSDHPPAEGKIDKTMVFENLPRTVLPTKTLNELAKLRVPQSDAKPPMGNAVLYSASWCGYCTKAKAYMAQKGIPYKEIDVDTPDGKRSFAQTGAGGGIPLLVANGQSVTGFSPAAYDVLFSSKR